MKKLKEQLKTYCELHWWNMGKKTLSFEGPLSELLKQQHIKYTCTRTDSEYFYKFRFTNLNGITFVQRGTLLDFPTLAKRFATWRCGKKAHTNYRIITSA